MRFRGIASVAMAIILLVAPTARGALLTLFTFNNLQPGATSVGPTVNHLPGAPTVTEEGTDAVGGGAAGSGFTAADGVAYPAGKALEFDSGVNDGANDVLLVFVPPTSVGAVLWYQYRSTASSPNGVDVQYRLGDSGAWTTIGSDSFTRDSAFHLAGRDLSGVAGLLSAAQAQVRLLAHAGTGSGTLRIDNLQLAAPLPGDVNGDGGVGFDDLLGLAQHFGQAGVLTSGNFNGDGKVDFTDLLALAQNYGRKPPKPQITPFAPPFRSDVQAAFVAIPEPAMLGMLAMYCPALVLRRRRARETIDR